jgi:Zn-dependent peptidase ImmA (M78 family)
MADAGRWDTAGRRPAVAGLVCAIALTLLLAACKPPSHGDGQGPRSGAPGPEAYPLAYSIGKFDDRFGISREQFLATAAEAEALWERAAGRQLFTPQRDATFKLNLVFDERQERTLEARKVKTAIDSKGRSYDALVWQHARRMERMKESEARYDVAVKALRKRLDDHNATVASWNEKGGAPAQEYARLERELADMKSAEADLERLRTDISDDVAAINDLVSQINDVATENNMQITYYNGAFVESREFEQGVYDGTGITIYQFSELPELRLALAHEFGHALGFDHVDDPVAVMHYKMGKQNVARPALAPQDLALLRQKFAQEQP